MIEIGHDFILHQYEWIAAVSFSELEFNRLRWRARRGMLELDLLLLPFFDEVFHSLPGPEQEVFIRLLEEEDQDLLRWFLRKGQAYDAELQAMVERVLKRVRPI